MTGTVVVVGSANVDLVVDVPRHPAGGETILGGDLRRTPGGKGANQAVAAARAGGADTSFVGALGRGESAELLLASLGGAGVRTETVDRVDAPTGTALITVSPDGENAIVVAPGANSRVRVGAAQARRIAAADVVLAQLEIPLGTVTAAALERRQGALFVLNAAPSRELPDTLWREVDVLVVNEHEAADLAGAAGTPEDLASALLDRVPAVVVTLGAEGSLVARRDTDPVRVPAARVDAVDTTGAGDTYCGVLAAGLARVGLAGLADAARLAGAAAALAVTRPGAQDAVPDAAEVAALAEGDQS
ncbi:ribokinase [Promicromonospora thailandica]|uniref:Ribokinase n=1 Tax=Promicromonospora thailandica TaxID=765201 RepID=A0A9X2G8V4_9MICO|nr:ribokinase [Promicromonospora thailandica]MCP2264081.1 ribokinase [Promicromonospora thailandica]BFF21262.1 ribokinase [Promicromonospora thailandica]